MQLGEPSALTIRQTSVQLQLHRNTIRRMLRVGLIRGVRIGKCWRIPCSEVQRICTLAEPDSSLKAGAP